MSSLYRIKENKGSYTDTEDKIADYILKHRDDVIRMSAQELADEVKSSAAAIIRFSKKIGYSGFTELKLELAKAEEIDENFAFDRIIKESDSLKTVVKKSEHENMQTFKKTYRLLDLNDLAEVSHKLKTARTVYLVGLGGSGVVCEDLYQKLIRLNVNAHYFRDFHLLMSALTHATEDDLCLALSYSGETREVVLAQKQAYEQGLCTVGISQVGNTSLNRYSQNMLYVPKTEMPLRLGSISSRFAMLALTDLLYLELARQDISKTRKQIISTRETIEQFEKK